MVGRQRARRRRIQANPRDLVGRWLLSLVRRQKDVSGVETRGSSGRQEVAEDVYGSKEKEETEDQDRRDRERDRRGGG